jgi:hypothetical protein
LELLPDLTGQPEPTKVEIPLYRIVFKDRADPGFASLL